MCEHEVTEIMTCIICPNSCRIEVQYDPQDRKISRISFARCPKGVQWVEQEILHPMRTVCTSVRVLGGRDPLVSVRTSVPVPKDVIEKLMRFISTLQVEAPCHIGDLICRNPFGIEVDLIATREVTCSDAQFTKAGR